MEKIPCFVDSGFVKTYDEHVIRYFFVTSVGDQKPNTNNLFTLVKSLDLKRNPARLPLLCFNWLITSGFLSPTDDVTTKEFVQKIKQIKQIIK